MKIIPDEDKPSVAIEIPLEKPIVGGYQPEALAIRAETGAAHRDDKRRLQSNQFLAIRKSEQSKNFPFLPGRD